MNRKLIGSFVVGLAFVVVGVASQIGSGQQVPLPIPPGQDVPVPELKVDDMIQLPLPKPAAPPIPPVTTPPATTVPPTPPATSSVAGPPLTYATVDAKGETGSTQPSKIESVSFVQNVPVPPVPKIEGAEPIGKQEPGVSIEWIAPPVARLNIPLACQILVKNSGQSPVYQVAVTYPLPPGVAIKGCEPRAVSQNNILTWSIGTLPPGHTQKIDLHVVATQRGDLTCNATVSFSGSSIVKLQVREPKLAMKLGALERTTVGENVTVNFVVTNPGDGTADQVKVRTQLPEGLEHARGRVLEFDVGNLAPAESRTVSLVCTAKGEGVQSVPLLAIAEGNLSVSDIAKIEVMPPRVDVAIAGPKLRYLDRHAVYHFKVSNPNKATASKVMLVDALPPGFKFHAASAGGNYDPNSRTVTWLIGDLLPGQSKECAVDVIATSPGDHKQVASAGAARGEKKEAQLLTKVEGIASLLIELADVDDPVEVGTEACYEIRVVNTGTKTETNLQLLCTLPDKMEFVGAKCVAGCQHRMEGRDLVFEPLAKLAPKADVIYRVVVRGKGAGDFRFRAHVRADGLTEPVLREESTRFYGEEITINKQ